MALIFLLAVFLLVIVLIALFVFPPSRWTALMTKEGVKERTREGASQDARRKK